MAGLVPTRWLRLPLICGLPMLAGLWVAATSFATGTFPPWHPVMVDLEVYRQVGLNVLRGREIYDLPGSLPFLYPPFAALLAALMALLPALLLQVGWVGINVVCLLAILYRVGLRGWVLSLGACATILLVEPVSMTMAFGQVGLVLVALVALDVLPGQRFLARRTARRWLPEGALSGVATAIKLTPGITMVYLLAAGRRRAGLWVGGSFLIVTAAAATILPGPSRVFWGRLAHGDTGLGNSIIYLTNQSVMGTWLRLWRLAPGSSLTGLLCCAAVAALGVAAAALWHRRGEVALAVCLSGVAGLLASPVSWSHHFVWIVPLGVVLASAALPTPVRTVGYAFCLWVAVAPYKKLPLGDDVELSYTGAQIFLSSVTTLLGVGFVVVCLLAALTGRRVGPASSAVGVAALPAAARPAAEG